MMNKYLLLFILFVTLKAAAQTCPPNIGFEKGDFTGWECYYGTVSRDDGSLSLTHTNSVPTIGRQQIFSKANNPGNDQYGGFPRLCPNGSNYSVQLGNNETPGIAERISYTFVVPANQTDYTIFYNWAAVLQDVASKDDLTHSPDTKKPLFSAQIYDVEANQYITCASFSFNSGASLPGFEASVVPPPKAMPGGIVYYKGWTSSSINLRGYAGKTIRLEFTARCCQPGGHFGYAYLDVSEPCGSSITGNNYCIDQKGTKLYAPGGYSEYNWYNADFSKLLATGNPFTLNPVPPDKTVIGLQMIPYAGLGCPVTMTATINAINAPFNFVLLDSVGQCPDKPTYDLTAAKVTQGSDANLIYTYYTDPDGLNFLPNPSAVTNGTYYIKGANPYGCSNILPIKVIISNPIVKVTNPKPVTYPTPVDLSETFTHDPELTYSYYYDVLLKNPIEDFENMHYTGSYYIKATSKYGCYTVIPVFVFVYPPPPPVVTGSNTFTPNSDGVNDNFSISIKGYGAFKSLKIFNRYGKEVFSSTDITTTWDGTYKGKPVPLGSYYWVFNGTNTYDRSLVHEAGVITLVR
ncbi:gliding motility-associated C-terminal domain-containing protein [Mucilaginibacter sp. HMF5004]|uniref:gliding motility-associated C-terminal domain-containing protein n=1 Tax=Mucilaginibacter rivuli TaxID=2857527 RepID=UPI001C5E3BDD|nr:gliding motility-associated C-terminal domain-containing protein [Mucilaginibacter rivuli]MBW4891746.1 gliding motility-associated C-terminal domain-containing protein [Mucilaginibacter rivuli]